MPYRAYQSVVAAIRPWMDGALQFMIHKGVTSYYRVVSLRSLLKLSPAPASLLLHPWRNGDI